MPPPPYLSQMVQAKQRLRSCINIFPGLGLSGVNHFQAYLTIALFHHTPATTSQYFILVQVWLIIVI